MSKATNGQQMLLSEALKLLDKNDQEIKWEKSEDGMSYTATLEEKPTEDKSGKKLAGYNYTYRIDVLPQIANVSVSEVVVEPEGTDKKKKTEEEARPKTIEEATASLATGEGSTAATAGKTSKVSSSSSDDDNNNSTKKHKKF